MNDMEENKKTYLIYIERAKMDKNMADRIAKLGDRVFMDTGLYLVKSEFDAFGIYDHLTAPPFEEMELFITEINPENGNTYGMWDNSSFWRFLGLYSDEQPKDGGEPSQEEKEA